VSSTTIRPLTRVEGAGEVLLRYSEDALQGVELRLVEPPRLFESLLCGRSALEVPALVARICAICSVPHALAAILALEQAIGLVPPPAATLVRELALLGNLVQSHALHLFALVLPDLRGVDSLLELLREGDRDARDGMELKQFGNRLQELAGGRLIHPVTLQLGGVTGRPRGEQLDEVLDACRRWQSRVPRWQALFAAAPGGEPAAPVVGTPLAAAGDAPLTLWSEALQGGGGPLPVHAYRCWLREQSEETSQAKRVLAPEVSWRTGALARRQLAGTRPPDARLGIFANNAAQVQELELLLARVVGVVEGLKRLPSSALLQRTPHLESGVGAVALEAPRGTLIHHYGVDDGGRIAVADIITPTTINQVAIEEQLFADLAGCPREQLKPRAEQIVRAFDPCISCAVHLIRT